MNPAEVAQSALPLTSSDLSIFGLFWSAHIIVKAVMLGLLIASIWVWAIAIDKTVLYARTRHAMDRFEKTFWSERFGMVIDRFGIPWMINCEGS